MYRKVIRNISRGIFSTDPQALVDKYYVGCYKDDVAGVKLLEGTSNDMQSYLSPTVCYKQCLIAGFLYFGVIANSEER